MITSSSSSLTPSRPLYFWINTSSSLKAKDSLLFGLPIISAYSLRSPSPQDFNVIGSLALVSPNDLLIIRSLASNAAVLEPSTPSRASLLSIKFLAISISTDISTPSSLRNCSIRDSFTDAFLLPSSKSNIVTSMIRPLLAILVSLTKLFIFGIKTGSTRSFNVSGRSLPRSCIDGPIERRIPFFTKVRSPPKSLSTDSTRAIHF